MTRLSEVHSSPEQAFLQGASTAAVAHGPSSGDQQSLLQVSTQESVLSIGQFHVLLGIHNVGVIQRQLLQHSLSDEHLP